MFLYCECALLDLFLLFEEITDLLVDNNLRSYAGKIENVRLVITSQPKLIVSIFSTENVSSLFVPVI